MTISLIPVNPDVGVRIIDKVANTDSYSWNIPYCYSGHECSSNFEIPAGEYKIQISGSGISDESDMPFNIIYSDKTADWKTYRNDEYGYEVKYPNNWEGIETSFVTDYASFTPEKRDMAQSGFWIRVYKNLKDLSVKEWWNKEYIKRNAVYESKEELAIAGIIADVYKEKDGLEFNYYVFSEGDNIYVILSQLADDKINQILSTFRFIEK